ncbi:MAG: DUF2339 domain-containing protein [Azonexus sp.]|jgi:uncharacterized membrane protein|nr:DUF2339 domain-containing protein [Azonexus sp.]
MLIWGAIWGAVLGLLWPYGSSLLALPGAILGLAAGWTLRQAVRTVMKAEIEAARLAMRTVVRKEIEAARLAGSQAGDETPRREMAPPPDSPPADRFGPPLEMTWRNGAMAAVAPEAPESSRAAQAGHEPPVLADLLIPLEPEPVAPPEREPPRRVTAPEPSPVYASAAGGSLEQSLVGVEQAMVAVRDWFIRGNPIVRAGLVILFIGLSFLARYAAQMGLLPVELRLAAVGAVGVALLVIGFRQRERRPDFGLVLQGGGVAVMYLTVFAAFRFYALLPSLAAFGLMVVVCALSCALALLQNSRALAFAAFAGGFATPLLLSTGGGNHVALFGYYTLLNLAILFIATRRVWRELNLLGFAVTFGMAGAWGWARYSVEHYASAQAFLAVFIAIFIATAILYARLTPLRTGWGVSRAVDSTLVFGTPLLGFGLQIGLAQPFLYGEAFSALAFGAVYLALATVLLRRADAAYRLLVECFLALGVGFATLAVPLALDAQWTSAVWALEGMAAFWVGKRQERWMARAFGLLLQALALTSYLPLLGQPPISPWPLAHPACMGALLLALPAVAIAWWARQPLAHSGSSWARQYAAVESRIAEPFLFYGLVMWLLAWAAEIFRRTPALIAGQWPEPVWSLPVAPWLMVGVTLFSAAALFMWGRRVNWPAATWPARLSLPLLALALLAQWGNGQSVIDWPAALAWPLALAAHFWLMRQSEQAAGATPGPVFVHWAGWQHSATVWLAAVLLGDALNGGIDRGGLWGTAWASVIGVVALTAVLFALTRWAGRANQPEVSSGLAWPLNWHGEAYYWRAALPLALLLWLGAFGLSCYSSGNTTPLPYIPLLNPTDLAVLLALGTLLLWRGMALAAEPPPPGAAFLRQPVFWAAMGLLALVAISTLWLRVAHNVFAVPWNAYLLYHSFLVQTGYAILWTLLALALMVAAHRRGLRPVWLSGAALLALVIVKLILVDLSNSGGGERIVAFIGVGALMLAVGYFAPLPPKGRPVEERASP